MRKEIYYRVLHTLAGITIGYVTFAYLMSNH
jgi:hypothetical protein